MPDVGTPLADAAFLAHLRREELKFRQWAEAERMRAESHERAADRLAETVGQIERAGKLWSTQ